MNTPAFSIKDAIGFGWAMVKEKFWFLIALVFVSLLVSIMPDMISKLVKDNATSFFMQVASVVLGVVIDAGMIYVALSLHDGKQTKVSDVFSQYPIVFRYFLSNVVFGLMIAVGLIFLIVPGIYLALRYQFYKYYLVDKQLGIVESFKESARITQEHMWQLLRFALMIIGINILGLIFFVIGLAITIPLSMLATAYVYRKLSSPITETEPIEELRVVLESLDQKTPADEHIVGTSVEPL